MTMSITCNYIVMNPKIKSSVFQVRIDPELLEKLQLGCAERRYSVSEYVRRLVINAVENWDRDALRAAKNHYEARQPVSQAHSVATPSVPVKSSLDQSESLRRANEKRARKRGK